MKGKEHMNEDFNPRPRPTPNPKKIGTVIILVVIILLGAAIFSTSWYTVDDKQQAVITTFGKVTDLNDAGIHFKIPFGIQKVHKVDANVYQKIELGYRSNPNDGVGLTVIENESKMITGDYNIVNVDFFVEYKVSDPQKFLFSSYNPELILKNLVQSQVRNVIGSTVVDSVLTDGKLEIEMRAKESITRILSEYDIGLMLIDVKIQDSEPPTAEVIEAFKAVETAKQGAETAINGAKAYQNAEIPKSQSEADKLIQNAEYLRQSRINEAVEQVARFEAMYKEYNLNPEITRSRMYYEVIEDILPGVKLLIDTSEGGVEKLLPIDSFNAVTR